MYNILQKVFKGKLLNENLRRIETRCLCMFAAKANSIFSYRNKTVWISLYKTYVRPHLEYCIQARTPWLVKDKETLERVQRRAITMTSDLLRSTYEEKLKEVG